MGPKASLDLYENINISYRTANWTTFLRLSSRSLVTVPDMLSWIHDMKIEETLKRDKFAVRLSKLYISGNRNNKYK